MPENNPKTISLLQRTMDDIVSRTADHPKTSLAVRLARAGRNDNVTEDTVETICQTIIDAVNDARAAYARAIEEGGKKPEPVEVESRVSLS